jgi:hypothetical protein
MCSNFFVVEIGRIEIRGLLNNIPSRQLVHSLKTFTGCFFNVLPGFWFVGNRIVIPTL